MIYNTKIPLTIMMIEIIGYIITVSLATIIPPFTVIPLELVAPSRFGLLPAFVYTIIGNALGATVAFMLAKKYGWSLLEKLFSKKDLKKARGIAKDYSFWKIVLARLAFASLFDVLSYVCGLTEIPLWKFVITTVIANIPVITIVLLLGNRLNLNFIFMIWFSVGIFLISVGILIRKLRKKSI